MTVVCPITAAAFVERYMGLPLPADNYVNYDKTDLVRNLETIKDKQLLLVHGTADRLVNLQHTMLLMKALAERSIPFRLQVRLSCCLFPYSVSFQYCFPCLVY
jgi:dipeptidyl aminopeptidase/acylaminoacyl peptidase